MLTARRSWDDGFTLIELVITVTIMSIVTVAITGVLFQYLRVSNESSARLNESTDQQFVSAYWQQDVSSAGLRAGTPSLALRPSVWKSGPAPSGVASACASPAGTTVVGLAWNDYPSTTPSTAPEATWDATISAAVYFTKTVGTRTELWRTRCGSGSTTSTPVAHLIDPASLTDPATGMLDPTRIVSCAKDDGSTTSCTGVSPFPSTISITLVVQDTGKAVPSGTGYTSTLTAETRQG
ncbi:prepilin-type N-terminal cleavage/methylation domain-containing protein [Nocardioides sp. URHA0032]|uniref:prepilin-type N-terminal cleavage/methylation domain-containing protein n=1 Tax=Nocardioides sp. URHA0032 TaxID=1380388 RepID=UPI0018CC00EA|nr:prepilin-type N-terminal cleavage/methylation domain-containing protein [Nocardioides sp. URHA0032]